MVGYLCRCFSITQRIDKPSMLDRCPWPNRPLGRLLSAKATLHRNKEINESSGQVGLNKECSSGVTVLYSYARSFVLTRVDKPGTGRSKGPFHRFRQPQGTFLPAIL